MKHIHIYVLICIAIALPYKGPAQTVDTTGTQRVDSVQITDSAKVALLIDSVNNTKAAAELAKADSIKKHQPYQPNPKKSGLYSALIPGMGQINNRQYWKLPIIYGGLAVAGYVINNNLTKFHDYRAAYIARINNPDVQDQYTGIYGKTELKQLSDSYEQNLSMAILFTSLGYIAQIMDAIAFAHLRNFDISPNLTMHMRPVASPMGNGAGIGLVMNFK